MDKKYVYILLTMYQFLYIHFIIFDIIICTCVLALCIAIVHYMTTTLVFLVAMVTYHIRMVSTSYYVILCHLGYRAVVVDVMSEGGVLVRFIDYGNSEVVPSDKVCVLNDEILAIPQLAIHSQFDEATRMPPISDDDSLSVHFSRQKEGVWQVSLTRPSVVAASIISPYHRPGHPLPQLTVMDQELAPGESHDVYVPYRESPAHFCCQLVSEYEALEVLMACMSDYYTNNHPECTIEPDVFCAAVYEKVVYRAKIVEAGLPHEVQVLFIDYGNQDIVASSQVYALNPQFMALPAQAFPCSTVTHPPADGFKDEQLESFFSYKFDDESFTITVKKFLPNTSMWLVDLFNQEGEAVNTPLASPTSPRSLSFTSETAYSYTILDSYTTSDIVDAFVKCVDSPSSFYCQPLSLARDLDNLMASIAAYMPESALPGFSAASLVVGQPCMGRFTEDFEWYRARIEYVDSQKEQVLVRYVDYGNAEFLTLEHLAPLPPQFLATPIQAIHCTVVPMEMEGFNWSNETVETFREIIIEEEQYTLSGLTLYGQKYFVQVLSEGTKLDFSSFALLEANKDIKDGMEQDAEVFTTNEIIIESMAPCPKGSKTPTTDLEESEEESTGEPLIHAPCKLSLATGEVVGVVVVHVQDPTLLYLQREDCSAEFESLSADIEQFCTNNAEKLIQQSYQPGDFVLATYEDVWYRARVTGDVEGGGAFEVQFIDYGNSEIVLSQRMIMCPGNYLELPSQAIPCSLSQVPSRDSWPNEYRELLEEATNGVSLQASVAVAGCQGMPATVTLHDVASGVDVSQRVLDYLNEECEMGAAEARETVTQGGEAGEREMAAGGKKEEDIVALDNQDNKNIAREGEEILEASKHGGGDSVVMATDDNQVVPVEGEQVVPEKVETLEIQDPAANDNVTSQDPPPNDDVTAQEDPPPNDGVATQDPPPNDDVTSQDPPSNDDVTAQDPPPNDDVTAQDPPPNDDVTAQDSPPNDVTAQDPPPNDDVTAQDPLPNDDVTAQDPATNSSSSCSLGNVAMYSALPRTLVKGSSYTVFLLTVNTPYDFVCQLASDTEALNSMTAVISELYDGTDTFVLAQPPSIGDLVCARYDEDGNYYRARVISFDEHQKLYDIDFIDYGNIESVSLDNLRSLESKLAGMSPKALHCSLSGLPQSLNISDHYMGVLVEKMLSLIGEMDSSVVIEIVAQPTDDGAYEVRMTTKDSVCVNDTISQLIHEYQQVPSCENDTESANVLSETDASSQEPSVEIETGNDAAACTIEEAKTETGTYSSTLDDVDEMNGVVRYCRYNIGDTLNVELLDISSLNAIKCRVINNEAAEIDSSLYQIGDGKLKVGAVKEGLAVMVHRDNKWYRGKINGQKPSTGHVSVSYVDEDTKEEHPIHFLKCLPECHAHPPTIITCKLSPLLESDFDFPDGEGELVWPHPSLAYFKKLVTDANINVEILDCDEATDCYTVTMTTATATEENLRQGKK